MVRFRGFSFHSFLGPASTKARSPGMKQAKAGGRGSAAGFGWRSASALRTMLSSHFYFKKCAILNSQEYAAVVDFCFSQGDVKELCGPVWLFVPMWMWRNYAAPCGRLFL